MSTSSNTIAEKMSQIAHNTALLSVVADEQFSVGYKAGMQTERDAFWDAFQNNGERKAYDHAFRNWTADTLRPKYSMSPSSCQYMFANVTGILDFEQWQKDCGITVDFSGSTSVSYAFYQSEFETFGELDFSQVTSLFNAFNSSHVRCIEKIILPDNLSTTFTGAFLNCTELEEVRFDGIIANNLTINASTKLSHDSIISIFNALYDCVANGVTTTKTLTIGEKNLAKVTITEWQSALSKGWTVA